jgi:undecaprenyl-diphosphatase
VCDDRSTIVSRPGSAGENAGANDGRPWFRSSASNADEGRPRSRSEFAARSQAVSVVSAATPGYSRGVDLALARAINGMGLGWIDVVTEALCEVGVLVLLWLSVLALVWWRDRPRRANVGAAVAIALLVHFLVNEVLLKHVLLAWVPMRVRPWAAHPDVIVPIGYQFEDSSFPSSHASSTAAIGLVLGWYYPRSRPVVVLFVLAMALARVHNGMHYPSDVVAGTVLGVLYGAVALAIVRRWRRRESITDGTRAPG